MPIQFRCRHCNQKLSITRRKAGQDVNCPACAKTVTVPSLDEVQQALQKKRRPLPSEAAPPGERDAPAAPPPAVHVAAQTIDPDVASLWAKDTRVVDPWSAEAEDIADDEFQLSRRGLDDSGMDMTPMVDVTFLLLIFFMITAAFDLQKSMQTTPPEPDEEGAAQTITVQDLEESSILVEIDANDNVMVEGDLVPGLGSLPDVLAAKMREESPPRTEMLIQADYAASHGIVVIVTDAGMEANMQHIRRVSRSADE